MRRRREQLGSLVQVSERIGRASLQNCARHTEAAPRPALCGAAIRTRNLAAMQCGHHVRSGSCYKCGTAQHEWVCVVKTRCFFVSRGDAGREANLGLVGRGGGRRTARPFFCCMTRVRIPWMRTGQDGKGNDPRILLSRR